MGWCVVKRRLGRAGGERERLGRQAHASGDGGGGHRDVAQSGLSPDQHPVEPAPGSDCWLPADDAGEILAVQEMSRDLGGLNDITFLFINSFNYLLFINIF